MSSTAWERRKAVSDRINGAFDALRDNQPAGWPATFEAAKARTVERMRMEAEIAAGMTFDEFARLQKLPMPKTAEA
jgi:hypothetical protein